MSRRVPDINTTGIDYTSESKKSFRSLMLGVITDTFLYEFSPTSIDLDIDNYFILHLDNKRFVIDIYEVDNVFDYIDVYLYGVKQPYERYTVSVEGNNIIVSFIQSITLLPEDVVASDFKIKGKIVEI